MAWSPEPTGARRIGRGRHERRSSRRRAASASSAPSSSCSGCMRASPLAAWLDSHRLCCTHAAEQLARRRGRRLTHQRRLWAAARGRRATGGLALDPLRLGVDPLLALLPAASGDSGRATPRSRAAPHRSPPPDDGEPTRAHAQRRPRAARRRRRRRERRPGLRLSLRVRHLLGSTSVLPTASSRFSTALTLSAAHSNPHLADSFSRVLTGGGSPTAPPARRSHSR